MNKALFGMAMMTAFGMASCANKPAQQQEEEAAPEAVASGNEIRINCLYKVDAKDLDKILKVSKELVAASQKDKGNIEYDIYQSQTDKTQLMIFETWQDQPSLDVHSAAPHFTRLVPQIANAAVGEMAIQSFTAKSEGDQIRINCMLKVAGENVTKALGLAQELVEASRKDGGNIDYDIYQSQTDPTHLMIFETWQDQPSLDTHSAAEHFTRIVPQLQEMAIGEMAIQIFKK
jgi:quinol monooxygenase YgiN